VVVDVFRANTTGSGEQLIISISTQDATCSHVGGILGLIDVNPGSVGDSVFPFNPGFVIPAGRAPCGVATDYANVPGEAYAYGYSIPASAAPSGASERSVSALTQQR